MQVYSIGKFVKIIGVTEQTLRNWDKKEMLKPNNVTEGGYRYHSETQVNQFF